MPVLWAYTDHSCRVSASSRKINILLLLKSSAVLLLSEEEEINVQTQFLLPDSPTREMAPPHKKGESPGRPVLLGSLSYFHMEGNSRREKWAGSFSPLKGFKITCKECKLPTSSYCGLFYSLIYSKYQEEWLAHSRYSKNTC